MSLGEITSLGQWAVVSLMASGWRGRGMQGFRRVVLSLTALASGAGLAAAAALPADAAASPRWRVVYHEYLAPPDQLDYAVVLAPGRSDAWALGGTYPTNSPGHPVAVRWNGRRWSRVAMPDVGGGIVAASAVSPSDIWAVTGVPADLLHWNGRHWSVVRRWPEPRAGSGLTAAQLTGVVAVSSTNVWVLGGVDLYTGLVGQGTWHYNGKTWTHDRAGAGLDLVQGSALSASDIWATGQDNALSYSAVFRYAGHRWTPVRIPAGDIPASIYAVSRTSVWAVGENVNSQTGPAALLHYNGRTWSGLRTDVSGRAIARTISPDGHGGVWYTVQLQPSGDTVLVHRTAAGRYSKIALAAGQYVDSLALIPGSGSLWGSGQYIDNTSTAQIWADGRIG
jgi:hypothetical protein